jgi:hypothetical protein
MASSSRIRHDRRDPKNAVPLIQIIAGPWRSIHLSKWSFDKKGVRVMPLESILFLSLVVGCLVLFAAALTYGERASKQAERESALPALHSPKLPLPSHPTEITVYKKAA